MLDDESFIANSKFSPADFTRCRMLTFRTLAVLLMAKGSRSLQLALNEFIPKLGKPATTVSKAAYSKARVKLRHTAFIELNRRAVVQTMYEDGDYKTLHGFRLLAVDGSKVLLPTSGEIRVVFGTVPYKNQRSDVAGEYSYALASVLYDVLNRVALDAQLAPIRTYEVDAAAKHLEYTEVADLVIYDRGYCAFRMLALATQASSQFLIRCPSNGFKTVRDMLAGKGPDDVVVTLPAPSNFLADAKNQGLPQQVTVRFIRVALDTGGYEVLATSLLDQHSYPTTIFKELYYLRWGVETFYGILKTRLNLENFSGLSAESIRQDFHAAVFLTGAETILTEDAEEGLEKQHGGQQKKVNKAVSFNVIKYRAFELFYSKEPEEQVLAELEELFQQSPTLVRKERKPPRIQSSSRKVLGFWKRRRKMVY
jgi:hypothetical protein